MYEPYETSRQRQTDVSDSLIRAYTRGINKAIFTTFVTETQFIFINIILTNAI